MQMNFRRSNLAIGLLITLAMSIVMLVKPAPLETFEGKLLDYRFRIRGVTRPPDKVVIAAIDDQTLERFGRWPWSRKKIADLVKIIAESGAEITVFDILFSEPETDDHLLSKAMEEAGNVILPVSFIFEGKPNTRSCDSLSGSSFRSVTNPEMFRKYRPISARSVLGPVPRLAESAMALGHINIFPDDDGTIRWEAMVIEHNGYLYPSIDIKAASLYLGVPPEEVVLKATRGIRAGKSYIPTDIWGRSLIHYYGPDNTFRYVCVSDIVDGRIKPDLLRGKIVLVGLTAVALYDLRVTPFTAVMPGVEKHANVISSILDNKFLVCAGLSTNILILLVSGSLFSLLVARFKAAGGFAVAVAVLFLILSSGYLLFAQKGLWINLTYPSLNIVLIFGNATAYNYGVEEKKARRIRGMFSSYVTERVVSELIKNPDLAKLGGERRELTVLFSDVKGFTTFSEQHAPEEVVATLNEYLGAMSEVIFRWEGTLDKFVGDAIVAFWGAPIKQENHAELAIRCALNMVGRLGELQQKWREEGSPVLDAAIGINTGVVVVGNIGAEGKKMDYTVIGDHVNLAARTEALTRKYDCSILVTAFTLEKIRGIVEKGGIGHVSVSFKSFGRVVVKGKNKPVEMYGLSALPPGSASEIIECENDQVVIMKEK